MGVGPGNAMSKVAALKNKKKKKTPKNLSLTHAIFK
jgi:hypothetical protein